MRAGASHARAGAVMQWQDASCRKGSGYTSRARRSALQVRYRMRYRTAMLPRSRMSDCADLLELARRNPSGLRFQQAVKLADCWGFRRRKSRRGTSHHVFKRSGLVQLINLQPGKNGMAKRYQVVQLLGAIELLIEQSEEAR